MQGSYSFSSTLESKMGTLPLEYRTWSEQREMHFHPRKRRQQLPSTKTLKVDTTTFTLKDKENEVQVRKVTSRAFQRH